MTTTGTPRQATTISPRTLDTDASIPGTNPTPAVTALLCPGTDRCEICTNTAALVTVEADTDLGVVCVTLCQRCRAQERPLPRLSVTEAAIRMLEHREHTGSLLDQQPATPRACRGAPTGRATALGPATLIG
jgi:hypothetical protein